MEKAKFKKGQKVFYPSADLGRPHIIESKITAITDDIDGSFYYNTELSYRIPEENIHTTGKAAKDMMMIILDDKAIELQDNVANAIAETEKKSVKELIKLGKEMQAQPE